MFFFTAEAGRRQEFMGSKFFSALPLFLCVSAVDIFHRREQELLRFRREIKLYQTPSRLPGKKQPQRWGGAEKSLGMLTTVCIISHC